MSVVLSFLALAVVAIAYSDAEGSIHSDSDCACDSPNFADFLFFNNNQTCLKSFSGGQQPKSVTNYFRYLTNISLLADIHTINNTEWYYYNPALNENYFVTESAYTAILIISHGTRILVDTGLGVVSPFYELEPIKYRIYQLD
jgi:hypothetical protein